MAGDMSLHDVHIDLAARLRLNDRVGALEQADAKKGAEIEELRYDIRVELPRMKKEIIDEVRSSRPNFVGWAGVAVAFLSVIAMGVIALTS